MFKEQEISENEKYSITTHFYTERNAFAAKMMANTSLTIRNTDWADEGNYACVASSHFGWHEQQLQLTVSNRKLGKSFSLYLYKGILAILKNDVNDWNDQWLGSALLFK